MHKVLQFSWLFVSLGIPPKIRFDGQNGGNSPTKIWLRYKIFRKFTLLWALQNLHTEFDILEKYRKSFNESELGKLHSVFPFERMAKAICLSENHLGRRNIFSLSSKIALMVHRILWQATGGTSEREHTLSDVLRHHDKPVLPHNQLQDSQCHP